MKRILLPLFAFTLALISCGNNSSEAGMMSGKGITADEMAVMDMPESQDTGTRAVPDEGTPQAQQDKKKIIRTGTIRIRVSDLKKARATVDEAVAQCNGYYASENYNDEYGESNMYLVVRVPNSAFDAFVAAVESGGGKVVSKEISARDITEQYLDTEIRLTNRRSYLARYRELLSRAGSIKEVLEVEEQIRQLEEEIESAEGRLRYMDDQVSYSTLTVILSQRSEAGSPYRETFWDRVKDSVSVGWQGLVSFVVVFLGLWPLWLILGAAVFVWSRVRRRRKQKKA